MYKSVFAKNFKGQNFEYSLSEKSLFVGPNGNGKSSISQALILCRNGYIPGKGKKPVEIMKAFSSGDKITVGMTHGKTEYERSFTVNEKGVGKQLLRINKKKATKDEFNAAMCGLPKIIDLSEFFKLSDQKKINHIFDLFPPEGDLSEIEEKIEKATDEKNRINENIRTNKKVIEKLSSSRSEIELPSGNLAGIQAEIKQTLEDHKNAVQALNDAIKQKEIKEAEDKAIKETKEKEAKKVLADEKKKQDAATLQKEKPTNTIKEHELTDTIEPILNNSSDGELFDHIKDNEGLLNPIVSNEIKIEYNPEHTNTGVAGINPIESIQKIMNAMQDSGCGSCAAMMICKIELKKYRS